MAWSADLDYFGVAYLMELPDRTLAVQRIFGLQIGPLVSKPDDKNFYTNETSNTISHVKVIS